MNETKRDTKNYSPAAQAARTWARLVGADPHVVTDAWGRTMACATQAVAAQAAIARAAETGAACVLYQGKIVATVE